jgi:hypothetical protein
LKLSKSFYNIPETENKDLKEFVFNMFEREFAREKLIETIQKQKKKEVKEDPKVAIKEQERIKARISEIEKNYIEYVNQQFDKHLELS